MKIENLKEGLILKNYKELCNVLEIKPTGGDSKKSQLKELNRYCEYHKEGNKFMIDKIYDIPKEKEDNRGHQNNATVKYVENIELNIIGELLTNGNIIENDITKTKYRYVVGRGVLLRNVGLTNINYSYCKRRQDKLATYLEINKEIVNDYYNCVDSMLMGNLEKALKNLTNKKLIDTKISFIICKNVITNVTYEHTTTIDEFDEEVEIVKPIVDSDVVYVEATELERGIILDVEKQILNEMNCDTISKVIVKGKAKEYYSKCYKELRKYFYDLNFYFKAYDIVYNFNTLANELTRLGYDDWSNELKEKQQKIINDGAMNRIINNAKRRQEKILNNEFIELSSTEKHYCRTTKDYIPNYLNLNNNVININQNSIRSKIKETKII